MKLLITGGSGFIGSNFIHYIFEKYPDYKITNLDKLTYAGNPENLKDVETNPNYRFARGDICNEGIVNTQVRGVDAIVNFAAETHVDRSIQNADAFVRTDILGTHTLLEAVKKHKIKRFVHISTDEVYGSTNAGSFKETDALNPSSPYSAAKAGADLLIKSYIKTFGLPAIITRSANNFGANQYPEKVIPLFVTNAIEDKSLPLYGDGLNVRDWLYVKDNCRAIDMVLHKGREGQVYNIGSGNEMPNIELTKAVLSLMGKPETLIKPVQDRLGHDRRYSIDCSKIAGELGWKPEFEFRKALKETILWYVGHQAWWKKLKK